MLLFGGTFGIPVINPPLPPHHPSSIIHCTETPFHKGGALYVLRSLIRCGHKGGTLHVSVRLVGCDRIVCGVERLEWCSVRACFRGGV